MAPAFHHELQALSRTLVRWQARLYLVFGVSLLLGVACLFGLMDVWMRYGRVGRVSVWLVLMGVLGATVTVLIKTLRHRSTTQGVAAMVEKAFPELDNHLINYIQFAAAADGNPFKQAYLERTKPAWDLVDPVRMKNEKIHRKSWVALALSVLLVIAPGFLLGAAWPRALHRVVNPFAQLPPVSLTRIVSVDPGETVVLQGDSLVLSCVVQGLEGHAVDVEIDADDAKVVRTALGHIRSSREETFARRIPKVTLGFRYRFRAGDAEPSAWQRVDTRPPTAFSSIQIQQTPPAYTGRPVTRSDARDPALQILQGARVRVDAVCNTPLKQVSLSSEDGRSVDMKQGVDATAWSGGMEALRGRRLILSGEDIHGMAIEEPIVFSLIMDEAPVIEVESPRGRTILPPGEGPRISFKVRDDFGLASVSIEQETIAPDGTRAWERRSYWTLEDSNEFQQTWQGIPPTRKGQPLRFRVVSQDECSFSTNVGTSTTVVFDSPSQADVVKERNRLEEKAAVGLNQIIEWQRENLRETHQLAQVAAEADKAQWEAITERQRQIGLGTRELLGNPLNPLGNMSKSVKKLYLNEMPQAVYALAAIPQAGPDSRADLAVNAEGLQERILRQLKTAEVAMGQSKVDRRVSGLTAMLEKMIGAQARNLKLTREVEQGKGLVRPAMIDLQDALASDLTEFIFTCTAESEAVRGNDSVLADTFLRLAEQSEQEKIRNDMIMAAEKLDQSQAAGAIPYEESSLGKLKSLQALLDGVVLQEEVAVQEAMREGVAQALEKVTRLKELHKSVIESMEQMKAQKDKSDEDMELMEESYTELIRNTKEAMLEVPTDLNIFMDLNVANEMVDDVFSIFQEIQQKEGSENWTEENVFEDAYAKELILLEAMETAEGRMDDVETWLEENPDTIKVTVEAFDQEEMPEEGIALGGLPSEVEDLISDLVEEDEEMADAADDGATNHAVSDLEAGLSVIAGDQSSFAAKGKSAAQRPDHSEQEGRSNVGRQGMANGETAASSGTVSEGDNNIEERRTADPTQSGQVDLAGEADTKATGGGKLATGKADDVGMGGGVKRMDSNEEGSWEGMAALMAQRADSIYAKASMKNIRVESLQEAAHHLRQSADAIAKGDIQQMKEFKRLAVVTLVEAKADLQAGPSAAYEADGGSSSLLDNRVESSSDTAPPQYQDRVAEYFKVLNEVL